MDAIWFYAVWTIGSYLLGSALVGDIVCRLKGVDIRKLGTGNPGTANIWRQVGPKYGIAVFVLDILKGIIVTLPLRLLDIELEWIAISMFCMLAGQFFPIFFRFQGNTGMAALFGTAAGLIPLGAAIAAPGAIIKFGITKNVGWSGGAFFAVSWVAGGLIYMTDWGWIGVVYLMIGSALVFIKQYTQYKNSPDKNNQSKNQ